MEKTFYVEGKESWRREYGTLLNNLPAIIENLNFIHSIIRLDSKPLRIIDYGCAYGYYLRVLKMINPNHELFGVDIAKEACEETARVVGSDHIFWQSCGDALPLEDNSVDIIYSFDMIEHVRSNDELVRFFKECARLIKPSGYIFIRTPNCNLPMKFLYS
jgi:2-polyprenyl-3-methyl-5-hydroxy-6-metoxy-1,4-benzoquinol methylase